MTQNRLAKPFTIAGFVAGEAYMLLTVLAPNLQGVPVPWDALMRRVVAMSLFFGPFGAAVGFGVGMLVLAGISGWKSLRERVRPERPKEAEGSEGEPQK